MSTIGIVYHNSVYAVTEAYIGQVDLYFTYDSLFLYLIYFMTTVYCIC